MDLMYKHLLPGLKNEDIHIINSLCKAFYENKRMQFLIDKNRNNYLNGLEVLISYCYFMVKKMGGVFASKKNSAFLLYYRKSDYYASFKDLIRYLYLAVFVIGIHKLFSVYCSEQQIKKRRKQELIKNNENDYLYVWFLAQNSDEKGLSELVQAKNHILAKAKQLNLSIYMETTDERLLLMYKRIGFDFYDTYLNAQSDIKVWFGRCHLTT